MPSNEEIWYAVRLTKTVLAPERKIETFGASVIDYYLVSELLDSVENVRIREGRIYAERPRVITPTFFANQLLENFGDDAARYVELLQQSGEGLRILQYGLSFRKQESSEEIVTGKMKDVAERIRDDVEGKEDCFAGVIIGVDDLWEVSLLKFATEMVQESAGTNFRELSERGLLESSSNNVPNAVRVEIESDFRQAAGDRNRIHALGNKLRKYNLLQEYQDRFFGLVKELE